MCVICILCSVLQYMMIAVLQDIPTLILVGDVMSN